MSSGGGSGFTPGATYTLKLGSTWDHIPADLIHAVQYDFKPASVDPSQPGQMRLEGNNGVTVLLPHKDTDESSEFKGNKQQTLKECFLVVDKASGTVYLEKVSNMIRVKKHRSVVNKKKVPVKKDEERASPIPAALQPKDRVSPIPAALQPKDRVSPIPAALQPKDRVSPIPAAIQPKDRVSPIPQPSSPKQPSVPSDPVKSEPSDSEPKGKRLKQSALISSGNLSSESSGSNSESSNDSSDSDNEQHFVPVKEEGQLDIGGAGMLITPLGEPDIKEEGGSSGDAIMNMLNEDLDLTDSDSD